MRLLLLIGATLVVFLALILFKVDISDIHTSASIKIFGGRATSSKRQQKEGNITDMMLHKSSTSADGEKMNETLFFTITSASNTTEAILSTEANNTKQSPTAVVAAVMQNPSKNRTSIMYTIARKDRSGAFIKDMICAHVYATRENYTYAGACNSKPQRRPVRLYQLSALNLLKFIGLEYELPFYGPSVVCPAVVSGGASDTTILVRQEAYDGPDRACSRGLEAWRQQMAPTITSSQAYSQQPKQGGAVLHIRRGDVSPCSSMSWVSQRYLSNRYYQQLIQDYVPPNMTVTIYSETSSLESWDNWTMTTENGSATNHTFNIRLDTPLNQVWQHIMTADIYILSRDSAFSYVPAILNMNASQVIFTPSTYFEPLPTWTVVPNETLEIARQDLEQLQIQHCPSKK